LCFRFKKDKSSGLMPRFVNFFSVLCLRFKKHKSSGLMPQFVFIIIYYYVFAFRFQKHKSCGLITKLVFFYSVCAFSLVDSHSWVHLTIWVHVSVCHFVSFHSVTTPDLFAIGGLHVNLNLMSISILWTNRVFLCCRQ
jgi:hypothetical protein